MIKHANISVFVPHIGCPNRCSFCNQNHITGETKAPTKETVDLAVTEALKSPCYNPNNTEIAFFGGSFTAIDKEYRLELLKSAYEYVKDRTVCGIRISTRPDAINEEIIAELKKYGVTAVELGAQSMDDEVLAKNMRGHTAKDVVNASKMIKSAGISLGLQMMTGLLGDTDQKALDTARKFIEIGPDTVRIYPTIVLKNTYLERAYNQGVYKPQTVESAASLCQKLLMLFLKENINVIRLGLHTIEKNSYVAGPWHPAFGEITESKIYLELFKNALKQKPCGNYTVFVNPSQISKAVGQKRSNITAISEYGYNIKIKEDKSIKIYEFKIKEE